MAAPQGMRGLPDMNELADYLGVSRAWVKERVSRREIPFRRFGKLIRFNADDVAAIEELAEEPAVNPYTKAS